MASSLDAPVEIRDRKEIQIYYQDHLGRGSYSSVVKGTFRGVPCACKVYTPRTISGNEELIREIRAYKKLNHENVTKLLGYYVNPVSVHQQAILVLELADLDLSRIIIPNEEKHSSISLWTVYQVFVYNCFHVTHWGIQMAKALEYLSSCDLSVVHRDLKPENFLMFSREINGELLKYYTCKLTDFNSAHIMKGTDTFTSGGSRGFAAPEMVQATNISPHVHAGPPKLDNYHACDIYSLGQIFHRMIDRERVSTEFHPLFCEPVREFVESLRDPNPANRPKPGAIIQTLTDWQNKMQEKGLHSRFEPVGCYRVRLNAKTGECLHVNESIATEDEKECKKVEQKYSADCKQNLRLTWESVDRELQDEKEVMEHKTSLSFILKEYHLDEAFETDASVKEAVDRWLKAQDEQREQHGITSNLKKTIAIVETLMKKPEDVEKFLYRKQNDVDQLVEQQSFLIDKIFSLYMKRSFANKDLEQTFNESHMWE